MKDLRKPAFMQRAMQGKPGHIAIIEILLAIAVFGVSFVAMGIIQFPLMFVELMSNQEYMGLIMQGDQQSMQEAMELSMNMAANIPEWMMILILLSESLMILVVVLYCRLIEKRKVNTMGFRKKGMFSQYVIGLLGGFLFFSFAYLLCVLTGSIHFDGVTDHIAPFYIVGYLVGYMIQGMAEEVLCRGYLFVSLTRRHSLWYSALLSAVFFAALHGINPGLSVLAVLNLILFGVFAALLLVKYENIWIVGAFHSIWNFVQGNIYGIQVSGNSLQQSVFASTCKSSHSFINGGAFGMEGGLAVTLVLGAGVAYLLWSLQREGKIVEPGTEFSVSAMAGMPYEMPIGDASFAEKDFQRMEMPPEGGRSMAQSGDGRIVSEGNSSAIQLGDSKTASEETASAVQLGDGKAAPEGTLPKVQPRRENMGVAPNETPWHPDQNVSEGTSGQNPNLFNADYFKD